MQTGVVASGVSSYVLLRMRRLHVMLFFALSRAAFGQNTAWKAPPLRIVDSVRVDVSKEQLGGLSAMALRGDGSIAIVGRGGQLVYFDSLAKRRWTRNLRPDVRMVESASWKGDSIILIDNLTDQVLAVGSNGGVGDILDFPDYVRPPWKDRKTMPAYGVLTVVAALADGSLVGTPRRPHKLAVYGSTTKPDPTRLPVLRVNADGIVQTNMATVIVGPKGDVWTLQNDGRLFLFRDAKDSLAFIAISPRGDTTFSRKVSKVRAVYGSVGGPDGTVWVSYTLGGNVFYHTVFDAKGVELGSITLPNTLRVGAGDARHLWVYEMRGQNKTITRYTLRP